MVLLDGQSEVNSAILRIEGLEKEIKNWDRYNIRSDFLVPTAGATFSLSTNETLLYDELLRGGVKVSIVIDGKTQFTGFIDQKRVSGSRDSGLQYEITCRDILGPVVSACLDPKIKIIPNQTVSDFLHLILGQFGITNIYIGDEQNFLISSGFLKGQGGPTTQTINVQQAKSRVTKDGKTEIEFETVKVKQTINKNRKDLKSLPMDTFKPRLGDGAYQMIEKILSRFGLRCWAMADGSGVVVDKPDFTTSSGLKIKNKLNGIENNVLEFEYNNNSERQPCCVVGQGFGGSKELEKSNLVCIAVNELVGLTSSGERTRMVQDIIARYPKAAVLPIRQQLIPDENKIVSTLTQKPLFFKDDESKTIDQLKAFTRKQLSLKQKDFISITYTVPGHTQNGKIWNFNTLVDVDDDFLDIHEPMWVIARDFQKSRTEGTKTVLKLIKPYTLELD